MNTESTVPFQEAIAEAEKLIHNAPFIHSEQDLAEGMNYLAGSIRASLQMAWSYQKTHPFLISSTGPYTKMGLDNPDTLYYHADIDDAATYRVYGKRGSTTDLAFQILKGDYTPTGVPGGDDAFDDRRISYAADGTFEIFFGPQIPEPAKNYFILGAGSSMLSIREVYSDWSSETKGSIQLERLDTLGKPLEELPVEAVTKRYAIAAKMLVARINTWFNFPQWFYLDLPVNTFSEPRLTPGGLATQFSSVGHFELADNEALIITVPKSTAPYQGFQLGSMWYISLDYVNHQTSLNSAQAQIDSDSMIRMVVSNQNPGITNWIETTGKTRGILQFRWQRLTGPILANQGPSAQVVDISDVPQHLPYYDENIITPQLWEQRIAKRQQACAARMLG